MADDHEMASDPGEGPPSSPAHREPLSAGRHAPSEGQALPAVAPACPLLARPITPTPTPPLPKTPVGGLEAYERASHMNKRRLGVTALEDDPVLLGTPRTRRFENLFPGIVSPPSVSDIVRSLHLLVEEAISLPKKGAATTSVNSEHAADIKTLVAKLVETNAASVAKSFAEGPSLGGKIDLLSEKLASIEALVSKPHTPTVAPSGPTTASKSRDPKSFAARLMAQPQAPLTSLFTQKRPQAHPAKGTTANSAVTLIQKNIGGLALKELTEVAVLKMANNLFAAKKLKAHPDDKEFIRVRTVHRYSSNHLVLYTESPQHAATLCPSAAEWIGALPSDLIVKPPAYPVVVHGIPASFNPANPEHIEAIQVANSPTLDNATFSKWANPKAVSDGSKKYSSIVIGLESQETALKVVAESVWYCTNRKCMELGRTALPRCFTCLKTGHTATHCPDKPLCPYCGDTHSPHPCVKKNMVAPKCTSCARAEKVKNPMIDLKTLFATSPPALYTHPSTRAAPLCRKEREGHSCQQFTDPT